MFGVRSKLYKCINTIHVAYFNRFHSYVPVHKLLLGVAQNGKLIAKILKTIKPVVAGVQPTFRVVATADFILKIRT